MDDNEFYRRMVQWKILEGIVAETVPVNENPGPYRSYILSPEAEEILKIEKSS